jgi:hypothetical protein
VLSGNIFGNVLGTLSVLGGGAGYILAGSITASINDLTQGAYNILRANSMAGSLWTPTGGGTTIAFPPAPPEQPKTTLDKAANAAAKAKAAAAARITQLDPPFPHEGQKFNRALLAS